MECVVFMIAKNGIKQRGFTLIELIVTLSLLSMVFVVAVSFFRYELVNFDVLSKDTQIKMNMDNLMNDIIEDVRATGDSEMINVLEDNGFLKLEIGDDMYTYDRNNLKVYKNGYLLADNITSFYVNIDLKTVNIAITGKGVRRYYTLSTSVILRR